MVSSLQSLGYGMDDPDIVVRLPAQAEIYSFLHIVLTSSGTQGLVHCVSELGQDTATMGNRVSTFVLQPVGS